MTAARDLGPEVPRVARYVDVPPGTVSDVLSDGWSYGAWVVGASRIRAVTDGWPQPGSRIEHSAGLWPLLINDDTSVLDWRPGQRLLLEARGWPAGTALIEVQLRPEGRGTVVSMAEDVSSGPALMVPRPLRQALAQWRNRECLHRLAMLAERRTDDSEAE